MMTSTVFLMAAVAMAAPVDTNAIPNTSDNPFVRHWHLPLGTVFIIVGAILGAMIVAFVAYHLATCLYYNRKARHEHETFAGHFTDLDQLSIDLSLDGDYAASLAGRLYRDLMLKRGLMYVSPTLSLKLKGLESVLDLTGLTIIESATNTGLNVDQLTMGGYTPTLNRLVPDFSASQFGSQSDTGRPALLFSVNHMAYQGEVLALYGNNSNYFNNMLKPGRRESAGASQRLSVDWLAMPEPPKPSDQLTLLLQPAAVSRRHSQVLEDLLAGTSSRPPSMVLEDLLTRMAEDDTADSAPR